MYTCLRKCTYHSLCTAKIWMEQSLKAYMRGIPVEWSTGNLLSAHGGMAAERRANDSGRGRCLPKGKYLCSLISSHALPRLRRPEAASVGAHCTKYGRSAGESCLFSHSGSLLLPLCSPHFHPNPKLQEQFSDITGGNVSPIPMEPPLVLKHLPSWAGRTECS